jgi:hypothetical protein
MGPLDPGNFPTVQNKFGAIPKSSGGWHLIVDLSAPGGSSMNDSINEEACSVSYITVGDAAREVVRVLSWQREMSRVSTAPLQSTLMTGG